MPEIPNVVPGEPVEADWGNDVRDRSVQRFADATARTASLPFPGIGQLTWLDDPGVVEYWDGGTWTSLADVDDLALKLNLSGGVMTGNIAGTSVDMALHIGGPLRMLTGIVPGSQVMTTSWADVAVLPVVGNTIRPWHLARFTLSAVASQIKGNQQGQARIQTQPSGTVVGQSGVSVGETLVGPDYTWQLPLTVERPAALVTDTSMHFQIQRTGNDGTITANDMFATLMHIADAPL